MTRASEFCYIAEGSDSNNGKLAFFLMGFTMENGKPWPWLSADPKEALRITEQGRASISAAFPHIGFRKVLAG